MNYDIRFILKYEFYIDNLEIQFQEKIFFKCSVVFFLNVKWNNMQRRI